MKQLFLQEESVLLICLPSQGLSPECRILLGATISTVSVEESSPYSPALTHTGL